MPLAPLNPLRLRHDPAPPISEGDYLTDGLTLFRVVSKFTAGSEPVSAKLEDCLTLEVRAYGPGELFAMGLRSVRPAD